MVTGPSPLSLLEVRVLGILTASGDQQPQYHDAVFARVVHMDPDLVPKDIELALESLIHRGYVDDHGPPQPASAAGNAEVAEWHSYQPTEAGADLMRLPHGL